MRTLKLLLAEITDQDLRRNFKAILEYVRSNPQLRGFRHVEIEFPKAVTEYEYPHGLTYQPKDVVQTSLTGAGSVTWHYDKFTKTNLVISTTGACTVRAYVGAHREEV